MSHKYTPEQEAWLVENYGSGDINDTVDKFEKEFGWHPSPTALYQKAFKLGLVKRRRTEGHGRLVERTIRWSDPKNDVYSDWLLDHDHGHSIAQVREDFEREFGFRIANCQVAQWRAKHRVKSRERSPKPHPNAKPIGSERDTGKGYVLVKVAERAEVPMSKDNWRMKHHLVWEEANGRPVPEGHEILFADHDNSNFSPDNLVAVDKRVVGILNQQGFEWWDAESLQVAVAQAKLKSKLRQIESGSPQKCRVCGATFEPNKVQAGYTKPVSTCPACLAAGKKSQGEPRHRYKRVCPVCHREFEAARKSQRRCPECISRKPKHAVEKQIETERKAG